MKTLRLLFLLACAFFPIRASATESSPVQSAAITLAAQLDTHPLIALGEHHASAPFHRFLQALLRDPRFICHVDDVVVESGNSGLQAIADRYVSGQAVPHEEKVRMWRDTTQWL